MERSATFFMRSPGGENEGGNINANDSNVIKPIDVQSPDAKDDSKEKPSLVDKIHDALQEWSNDDQREQEFDDTRP